jgi:hypothetical protein
MVIRKYNAKIGYGAAAVVSVIAAALVALVLPPLLGSILVGVVFLAAVLLGTRWFRGSEEGDGPRSWWRMTGRPAAGFVLGGILVLTCVSNLAAVPEGGIPWGIVVAQVIAGVAYLYSSFRLVRTAKTSKPAAL